MSDAPVNIPQSLQELLPKWAHFCLYTEKFITDELGLDLSGKRIVVGLSGGADSTALLLVLHYLCPRNDCHVVAVHLNHMLREEADAEEAWCRTLCESLSIEFISESRDIKQSAQETEVGLEEAGRNARYELFQRVLHEKQADFVALGHHRDDLSEDVLMRFIRGTGWPGLSGMAGFDPDRNLIRPFLMLPKSTLKAFLAHAGVKWLEDVSNDDPQWTRNRIRKNILPLIFEENPNFGDAVARLWKIGRIETDYWDDMTRSLSENLGNDLLEGTHKAARLRMYKARLDDLGPAQVLAHSLFKLDQAWEEKRVGAVFQFPGEKTATITASGVVFSVSH
jgi:tRNA(Ile)-lysidine synthase